MTKRSKSYKARFEPYSAADYYEIVLYQGEEVIDQGTVKEIAERRGVQKRTIRYYLTPAGGRRADARKSAGIRAVRV